MTLSEMLALRDMRRCDLVALATRLGATVEAKRKTNDALRLSIIFVTIRRGNIEEATAR